MRCVRHDRFLPCRRVAFASVQTQRANMVTHKYIPRACSSMLCHMRVQGAKLLIWAGNDLGAAGFCILRFGAHLWAGVFTNLLRAIGRRDCKCDTMPLSNNTVTATKLYSDATVHLIATMEMNT